MSTIKIDNIEYVIHKQESGDLLLKPIEKNKIENNLDLQNLNESKSIYFFVIDDREPQILEAEKTIDIIDRLRNYNVGKINQVELRYICIIQNNLLIEKCLKLKLKKNQVSKDKEIFKVDLKVLIKIIRECDCKSKCISSRENEELNEEISELLKLYTYTKNKIHIKPYVIIN